MNPLIGLFAHPRSMSTATERTFRQRGDLTCFHEPFLVQYYVGRGNRDLPYLASHDGQATTYEECRDRLLAEAEERPVMFKDMSFYVIPELFEDDAFRDRLTHIFIIRDPRRSIPSYMDLDPDVTLEEIGYEAQWKHADAVDGLVIEAETIVADPVAAVAALFEFAGLTADPTAVEWSPTETPADWQFVDGWHETVIGSAGFRAAPADDPDELAAAARARHPRFDALFEHHVPFYQRLKSMAWEPAKETTR